MLRDMMTSITPALSDVKSVASAVAAVGIFKLQELRKDPHSLEVVVGVGLWGLVVVRFNWI